MYKSTPGGGTGAAGSVTVDQFVLLNLFLLGRAAFVRANTS